MQSAHTGTPERKERNPSDTHCLWPVLMACGSLPTGWSERLQVRSSGERVDLSLSSQILGGWRACVHEHRGTLAHAHTHTHTHIHIHTPACATHLPPLEPGSKRPRWKLFSLLVTFGKYWSSLHPAGGGSAPGHRLHAHPYWQDAGDAPEQSSPGTPPASPSSASLTCFTAPLAAAQQLREKFPQPRAASLSTQKLPRGQQSWRY